MSMKTLGAPLAVLAASALALSGCASNTPAATSAPASAGASAAGAALTGSLSGAGSSAQEQAMTAWIAGYKTVQPNVTVQYNSVGSGSGRKNFLAGQVGFAGSDAALKTDEWEQSKALCGPQGAFNVPAYVSPLAMAYNLGAVKSLKLDPDTAAKIFKGQITTWNDPAIAALNAGVTLPATKITVVHRSDDSGTTENFTDYLSQAAPTVWTDAKAQKWPIAGQESAQGTSGVIKLVQSTDGAIGYADESAVGALGTVQVKVGDAYVGPSAEGAAKAVELSKPVGGQAANDMAVKLDRKPTDASAYPIVLVTYEIFCNQYKDANTAALAKSFGTYLVSAEGQKAAQAAAKNAPLSSKVSADATAAIDKITVAS